MKPLSLLYASSALGLVALGWCAFIFFVQPIRRFFFTRREVRQFALLHWSDPANDLFDPKDTVLCRETLNDLQAGLGAFAKGEPFAAWVIGKMGFNPPKAAWALRNLGIGLGADGADPERALQTINKTLKLQINPEPQKVRDDRGGERPNAHT